MTNPETVIVVPTTREACIVPFLEAWEEELSSHRVIVIEDNQERTFDLGGRPWVDHYCWRDIDAELGERSWIIPRHTDSIRSFGYYKAWQLQPDLVITLDDDCYPLPIPGQEGFIAAHWRRLEEGGCDDSWVNTLGGVIPRGHPYQETCRINRCVINHGLWRGVPGFDAVTQLAQERAPGAWDFPNQTIPRGSYFPMCGTNLAFRPEIIPALYFLLMGKDHPVDRFGDIWSGLFAKRICDHLGLAVNSGDPTIDHRRDCDVWNNLRMEAPGLEINETLWRRIDAVVLTGKTVVACYRELAAAVCIDSEYGRELSAAMHLWADLLDGACLIPIKPVATESTAPKTATPKVTR